MRVFVVGTGRCGSVSFRYACGPITNYTRGHETPCGLLYYPDSHIEVNPQLRYSIPHLADRYPDSKWVHLVRERVACARSIAMLNRGAFCRAVWDMRPTTMPSTLPEDVACRWYDDWTATIDTLLAAKVPEDRRRTMHLESIKSEWRAFWDWIGAEGDYAVSLAQWDILRNTSKERGDA